MLEEELVAELVTDDALLTLDDEELTEDEATELVDTLTDDDTEELSVVPCAKAKDGRRSDALRAIAVTF